MLAILWLIVWATVGDAYYDDYNWYTSDDGVSDDGRDLDTQKAVRANFSTILRSLADSYIPTREGDDELTLAKVKSRLRMLKVFAHTGNSKDFEPSKGQVLPLKEGARFCTMGRHTKVDCNHCTCVAGQLYMCTGMICPKAPAKPRNPVTCKEGKRRKVDSCNYCYCRNGHEICSTRDCRLQHDHLLLRSKYTCHEGARRKIDCNRCVCRNGEEYCSIKKCTKKKPTEMKLKHYQMPVGHCNNGQTLKIDCNVCKCNQNRWRCSDKNCGVKHKPENLLWAKCREGATRLLDACNTCYCHLGREFCERKNCEEEQHDLQYYRYLRDDERPCNEGSYRKPDPCNYCLCLDGTEICTTRPCRPSYSDLLRRRKECDRWDVKYLKCNRCECQARRWVCTRKLCDGDAEHISQTDGEVGMKNNDNYFYLEVCSPGEKRTLGCNTCYCREGKWFCQIKECTEGLLDEPTIRPKYKGINISIIKKLDVIEFFKKLHEKKTAIVHTNYEQLEPKEHGHYSDNDMMKPAEHIDDANEYLFSNILENSENNQNIGVNPKSMYDFDHAGLEIGEPALLLGQPQCKSGTKKEIDSCNYCYCRKGLWFCTDKDCGPYFELLPENCTTGEEIIAECIPCTCENNRWNCFIEKRHKGCIPYRKPLPTLEPDQCKKGDKKIKDCVPCTCRKGRWKCNKKKRQKNCTPDKKADLPPNCKKGDKIIVDCVPCTCKNRKWKCNKKKKQKNCTPEKKGLTSPEPPEAYLRMTYQHNEDDYTPKKCVIGERYRIDICNYCYCNRKRELVCSDNKCTYPQHVDSKFPLDTTEQRCKIGSRFRKGECNYCYCDYNRRLVCSNNKCSRKSSTAPKICLRHERFRLDNCNWCYCNKTRHRVCQDFVCPPGQKPDDRWPPNSPRQGCFIGSRFSRGKCGYCYCTVYRKIRCLVRYNCTDDPTTPTPIQHITTPSTKPRSSSNFECEEGDIQPIDDCNFCRCSKSRKWMCSENECPSNYNKPGSTHEKHLPSQGFNPVPKNCLSHERFRLDSCNWCYCNENRQRVCERNLCDPKQKPDERWPQNSPKKGCYIGSRFERGKCGYCYCNIYRKIECRVRYNCTETTTPTTPKPLINAITRRTRPRNFLSYECEVGETQQIDDCNYCRCTYRGNWMCSDNDCQSNNDHQPTDSSEPECLLGEPVPAPDPCNRCMCVDSAILCTDNPCIQRQSEKTINKNIKCVEGQKIKLEDGCNFCICQGGQHFCTSRACLVSGNIISKSENCNEGEVTPAEDGCNMCVCMAGKIICTNKDCSRRKLRENLLSHIRTQKNKKHKMTQGTKQKCSPGKKYFPDDFDPNCPNECICDRHELLCTKRKCFNNWDKQTPFKWPLGRVEKKSRFAKHMLNQNCVEYQKLPSDDPCNSCMCLNGRKVCTIITCTDDNEGELGSDEALFIKNFQGSKGNKGNMEKKNNTFCEPFTFFSPDNNRFCRNCFCLHNALALCLLNLCKYSKDIPHQNSPEELDEVCTPGEIGYPTKCVTCTCSEQRKWICTREDLALCQERDCDEKDEFHMGFFPYCAGCKCSVKEWFCSIQNETCRDFSNVTCPIGTFIHNPKEHCSICLCGGYEEGSHNMCFTEAKCVRQVISQMKQ